MNGFLKYFSRVLLTVSGCLFILGLVSVFYVEVKPVYVNIKEITLYQNGYTDPVGRLGSYAKNNGGNTKFVLFSYKYMVGKSSYSGAWMKIGSLSTIGRMRTVYYNPVLPMFSVLEKGVSLFWVIFLGMLGYGLLEVRNWLYR